MAEPVWVAMEAVIVLHDRSLALHGGAEGVRDLGLLEAALTRPANRRVYEEGVDLVSLAATYAVAVSSNHPFVDGNKRAAFACMTLFLRLNGLRLTADQVDATRAMLAVASGDWDIARLSAWLAERVADATPPPAAA